VATSWAVTPLREPHDQAAEADRLSRFGDALHPLQDSWSHQGAPDIPPTCDKQLAWGHPAKRGGWYSHIADLTYLSPMETNAAAKATYDIMKVFLDNHQKWARKGSRSSWDDLLPDLREFTRAATKNEKRLWFTAHHSEQRDLSFLDRISLPMVRRTSLASPCPRVSLTPRGVCLRSFPVSNCLRNLLASLRASLLSGGAHQIWVSLFEIGLPYQRS